jgi:hypothetical protein
MDNKKGRTMPDGTTPAPFQSYSTVTCPRRGHQSRSEMPLDACVYFYQCPGRGVLLKPEGDASDGGCACVYFRYGDLPCPPVQTGNGC